MQAIDGVAWSEFCGRFVSNRCRAALALLQLLPMNEPLALLSTNTILYCRRWRETVEFYQRQLQLPVTFSSDWLVEFQLSATARLSVADERRASIKSSGGQGLTLTWQVDDIELAWRQLHARNIALGPIKHHPWSARVFYFYDPEGHRLEIWSRRFC
jgi:catechol 2,3-dioxygenase-like lactoylglutathione lyase family enzyme